MGVATRRRPLPSSSHSPLPLLHSPPPFIYTPPHFLCYPSLFAALGRLIVLAYPYVVFILLSRCPRTPLPLPSNRLCLDCVMDKFPPPSGWDVDAWSLYAAQATSQPPAVAVAMLSAVVEAFPTAGNKWRALADATDRLGDKAATTRVYERGVVTARASVDLWRAYTAHAAAELPHAAATAVFEAAVHAVGLDPGAHPLWVAFIDHVRAAPAHSTVADSHKRDALRRAFQRAVRAPVAHLDTLWRDYETFELSSTTNKDLARGILGEITPAHVAARAEHRARVARRKTVASAYGGNLTSGAAELSPPAVGSRPEDVERARAWRRYIASEARNPHGLEAAELVERVVAAYEAALGAMYRSAVLWLDAIDYMATTAKDRGRAIKMLDRSIKPRAIPNTHLRPTDAWSAF